MEDYSDVLGIYQGEQLQLLLKIRECKARITEALKLVKTGQKDQARETMEVAEDLMAEATEISAELFSDESGGDDVSLRKSFVLDSLSDCQTTLELSREIMELY